MNADYILKADLLDIIFEKRNKDYGAYELRKHYNKRLFKSLGIAFLIIAIFSLLSVLKKSKMLPVYEFEELEMGSVVPEVPIEKPVPETPQPAQPPQPVNPVDPVSSLQQPAIINDAAGPIVFTDNAPNIDAPNYNSGTVTGTDSTAGNKPYVPQSTAGPAITKPVIDKTTALSSAEIMPSFPGGMGALREFLEKNLTPQSSLEPGDMVSVKVKFIVGYDGKLKGFEVVEDGGEQYNNEVIRVLKKMPAWIPGKSHGENVSVYYVVPVKFMPRD